MKAIILAAGVSRRLYPITYNTPKCLLELGGRAIIDYQLEALRENGVTEITIVTGYHREKLAAFLAANYSDIRFDFVINQHFFETNTSYSVYLCADMMKSSDTILMNADVLYPPEVLQRIIASAKPNVLAVEIVECDREEVKVIEGANRRIVAIGKELIPENCLGEFIGVAKFSAAFNRKFAASLEKLIDAGGKADYFEAAIHPLLADNPVHYVDISDLPCIEIDFIEDYHRAKQLAQSNLFSTR